MTVLKIIATSILAVCIIAPSKIEIIVALIFLACLIAPSEVDLYFKKKDLERRKKEYEIWQKYHSDEE